MNVIEVWKPEDDVTNPEKGTLRYACLQDGPKQIIFKAPLTIALNALIRLEGTRGSNVAFIGDEAPVQVTRHGILVCNGAHDVSFRRMRFRKGFHLRSDVGEKPLAVFNTKPGQPNNTNISVVQCSLEGGTDGNFACADCENVHVRQTIIGKASQYGDTLPAGCYLGDPSWNKPGQGSQGAFVGGHNTVIEECLFACNRQRNPRIAGHRGDRIDFIRCVFHKYEQGPLITSPFSTGHSPDINFLSCIFVEPSTIYTRPITVAEYCSRTGKENGDPSSMSIYISDDTTDGTRSGWDCTSFWRWPGLTNDNTSAPKGWSSAYNVNGPMLDWYRSKQPFSPILGEEWTSIPSQIKQRLTRLMLLTAGALPRDPYDIEIIRQLSHECGTWGISPDQQPPLWGANNNLVRTGHENWPSMEGLV